MTASEALSPNRPHSRYAHVDALRAIAVMLVVVAHAGLGHVVPGGAGVTIFFTISGFIITHLLLREWTRTGGFSSSHFYLRRFLKIAPPMVGIVLIPTVIYIALGYDVALGHVAAQVFFVFNWVHATGHAPNALPGSGVVWSLAIEEQFYILFAAVWLLAVRSPNPVRLLGWGGALVAIASAGERVAFALVDASGYTDRIYYGSDTRAEGLAIGVLTAVAFFKISNGAPARLERLTGHPAVPYLACAGFLFSLVLRDEFFRDTARFSIQSLATAALILYGFKGRGPVRPILDAVAGNPVVRAVGLASYSIYLIHLPLILLAERALDQWTGLIGVSVAVVGSVAAGILFYRVVEVPFERLRGRLPETPGKAGLLQGGEGVTDAPHRNDFGGDSSR